MTVKSNIKKAAERVGGRSRIPIDKAYVQSQLERVFGQGWNRQAAKAMGVDEGTMSRLTNGLARWTPNYQLALQGIIRRPMDEIIQHLAPDTPIALAGGDVKVVGHVSIDGMVTDGPGGAARRAAMPPGMVDALALAVYAPGSAMDKWVLYYGPAAAGPEHVVGRLCVVRRPLMGAMVGMLRKGSVRGLYSLTSLAGFTPASDEGQVSSASAVEWIRTA